MHTVFGPVTVPNPRWYRCACQESGPLTFRPTAQWLTGHTSPDLLYLETKRASLIPYAKVVDLLHDVLPVAETLNLETVRQHFPQFAQCSPGPFREASLGTESRSCPSASIRRRG